MRVLGLLVVLVVPAAADDNKKPDLPDIVKEATKQDKLMVHPYAAGLNGSKAAGVVIEPPDHADEIAVIVPPDINDPMALEMGTNRQRSRVPRHAWLPRDWSRAFKAGADKVWDLVLPKL